jgi:hypothetical protein
LNLGALLLLCGANPENYAFSFGFDDENCRAPLKAQAAEEQKVRYGSSAGALAHL